MTSEHLMAPPCNETEDDLARLVAIRRDLHAHPELSLQEARTAKIVADYLRECGAEVTENIGGHGVVGTLRGRSGTGAIALRADMDALAIVEKTNLPHASRHAGVMHACGHDGHTTMLLGAARALSRRQDLPQDVHFVFQPAEEHYGGAKRMIDDGLFKRFPCRAIYGLHNSPSLPAGHFSTRSGPLMAAVGMFTVMMEGPGGHGGAAPHRGADLTIVQAEFVLGLQTRIRRGISPTEPVVVTVGHVSGGVLEAPNVMPSEMQLSGTIRCFDLDTCRLVEQRMTQFARLLAEGHDCVIRIDFAWEAVPLINPPEQVEIMVGAATAIVGGAMVDTDFPISTGGEDFADMMLEKPGGFMFLGNGDDAAGSAPLHSPHFDFNDRIIPLGIAYWVALATGTSLTHKQEDSELVSKKL